MTQAGIILPSDEHMLVVRPCFKALCADNKPASKLLSVLCYIYKNSKDQTLDENGDFYITRTQSQLLESMCDEIDVSTLQRVAIPTLVMFGYIDLIEQVSSKGNIYILHVSHVNSALSVYNKNDLQPLTAWLEESIKVQLGKFLIEDLDGINKENSLLNKENSLLLLGKFLIAIRKNSNCRRGRKPSREAALEGKSKAPKISKDNSKINDKKRRTANAAKPPAPFQPVLVAEEQKPQRQTKPVVTLDTPEQEHFWSLWCSVWFNQEVKPTLNETAKGHVVNLAPRFKTQDQLNSYEKFTRKELEESGQKRKIIFLGNLDNNDRYIRWKQTQPTPDNVTSLTEKKPASRYTSTSYEEMRNTSVWAGFEQRIKKTAN